MKTAIWCNNQFILRGHSSSRYPRLGCLYFHRSFTEGDKPKVDPVDKCQEDIDKILPVDDILSRGGEGSDNRVFSERMRTGDLRIERKVYPLRGFKNRMVTAGFLILCLAIWNAMFQLTADHRFIPIGILSMLVMYQATAYSLEYRDSHTSSIILSNVERSIRSPDIYPNRHIFVRLDLYTILIATLQAYVLYHFYPYIWNACEWFMQFLDLRFTKVEVHVDPRLISPDTPTPSLGEIVAQEEGQFSASHLKHQVASLLSDKSSVAQEAMLDQIVKQDGSDVEDGGDYQVVNNFKGFMVSTAVSTAYLLRYYSEEESASQIRDKYAVIENEKDEVDFLRNYQSNIMREGLSRREVEQYNHKVLNVYHYSFFKKNRHLFLSFYTVSSILLTVWVLKDCSVAIAEVLAKVLVSLGLNSLGQWEYFILLAVSLGFWYQSNRIDRWKKGWNRSPIRNKRDLKRGIR